MANYNFEKDIELGEEGEYRVRLDLESVGGEFVEIVVFCLVSSLRSFFLYKFEVKGQSY